MDLLCTYPTKHIYTTLLHEYRIPWAYNNRICNKALSAHNIAIA